MTSLILQPRAMVYPAEVIEAQAAENARLRAALATRWRPIATAPDNVPVLIFVPPFAPMQGVRSKEFGTWMAGARGIIGRTLDPGMEPTHWMPLPEPPEGK